MTNAMARTHNAPSQLDASKPNIATSPPRRWLGWDGPILPRVVQQLRSDYAVGGTWDMRQVMIVLPGGLARRRLGELLAVAAKQYELILYPPQIVTVGTLPEQVCGQVSVCKRLGPATCLDESACSRRRPMS
ncbi:MAG: hypothetical protein R3C56_16055 [Pirellulaceae bacterium]